MCVQARRGRVVALQVGEEGFAVWSERLVVLWRVGEGGGETVGGDSRI